MRKIYIAVVCLLIASCIFFVQSTNCLASSIFDLVQEGTGDVLATLELSSVPASSASDIVGLSFSAEGNAIFGFGVGAYPGTLDSVLGGPVSASPTGILRGPVVNAVPNIIDSNPPPSSTAPGYVTPELVLRFQNADLTANSISMIYRDLNFLGNFVLARGVWQSPIPEPTTCTLTLMGICLAMTRRKSRP